MTFLACGDKSTLPGKMTIVRGSGVLDGYRIHKRDLISAGEGNTVLIVYPILSEGSATIGWDYDLKAEVANIKGQVFSAKPGQAIIIHKAGGATVFYSEETLFISDNGKSLLSWIMANLPLEIIGDKEDRYNGLPDENLSLP
jgi:hypothetical protein